MSKTGRNELCPCGSEKKYKRCCYDKDMKTEIILNNHVHDENCEHNQEKV